MKSWHENSVRFWHAPCHGKMDNRHIAGGVGSVCAGCVVVLGFC